MKSIRLLLFFAFWFCLFVCLVLDMQSLSCVQEIYHYVILSFDVADSNVCIEDNQATVKVREDHACI